jgi:hypothetical protein
VFVDGVSVGVTPLNKFPAREGARVVRLVHPGFEPLERRVTVRAGQLTKLEVDLRKEGVLRKP